MFLDRKKASRRNARAAEVALQPEMPMLPQALRRPAPVAVISVLSLFDRFDQLVPHNLLASYTVLGLGLDPSDARDVSRWSGDLGGILLRAPTQRDMFRWLTRNPQRKALLLVNCDSVGDAEANCDLGLGLRHFWRDLVVIFASSEVRRDDFSKERLPICDATLRMPFAQSAFKLGCGVAIENHAVYQRHGRHADACTHQDDGAGVTPLQTERGA